MSEDFYKTLGVSRDASQADIQSAYRKLARKYHPDLNPDDQTAKKHFQEVQSAFDVLNDPSKRELYDRYGSSFETMGRGPRPGGPGGARGAAGGEDFDFGQFFGERFSGDPSSVFGDMFSQFHRADTSRSRRGESKNGADLLAELEIPFSTAVLGGEAQLSVRRKTGAVETISVKIPAGIEDGKKIRLRGQGESGRRGQRGDLLIAIRVAPHPFFFRRGFHLGVKVPVTVAEAALGAKVDIPTPRGTIALRIPPGTSSGAKLRVKGYGIVPKEGEAGDLFAEVQIVVPKETDEESQKLIQQLDQRLRQLQPGNPREGLRW